jgi:hypothetical protein
LVEASGSAARIGPSAPAKQPINRSEALAQGTLAKDAAASGSAARRGPITTTRARCLTMASRGASYASVAAPRTIGDAFARAY